MESQTTWKQDTPIFYVRKLWVGVYKISKTHLSQYLDSFMNFSQKVKVLWPFYDVC